MKVLFLLTSLLFIKSSFSAIAAYRSAACEVGYESQAEQDQSAGTSRNYTMVTDDGLTRTYIVHLPTDYKPKKMIDLPVIYALPGFLTSAQRFHDGLNINGHSDDNGYIIVYAQGNEMIRGNGEIIYNWNDLSSSRSPGPQGPICDTNNLNRPISVAPYEDDDGGECSWTNADVDDIAFIDQLIEQIENDFCIDTTKRYVIGFSNGGMMTQRLACDRADIFAAAVPMHGQLHIGDYCMPPSDVKKMPIMNIWGTNDQILPGMSVVSRSGWYFLPVMAVQDAFSIHNNCTRINGQEEYPTASDDLLPGGRTWNCTGFVEGCEDAQVVQCAQTWGHDWPINPNTGENWAIETIWDFLSQFENLYDLN